MNCSTGSSSKRTARQGLHEVEVSTLRQEIMADTRQCFDIARFAVLATAAILGFALAENQVFVALLPTVVLFAAREQIINRKGNTLRIASYLKVFGGQTIRYEERLWQLRNLKPPEGWSVRRLGSFKLLGFAGYMSVITFSIALYSADFEILPIPEPFSKIAACLLSGVLAAGAWGIVSRWQSGRLKNMVDHNKLERNLHQKWNGMVFRNAPRESP